MQAADMNIIGPVITIEDAEQTFLEFSLFLFKNLSRNA
jgi:hypothetical protein